MSKTQPARGMRDFLPVDVRKREYVIGIIKEVYESYGFEPLETPAVENIETLTGKYGEEGNQLIYKILKRGDKLVENLNEKDLADLALRYDLTVPLARVVANYRNELPKFFKRYQIQPVWRADRPARGRYREFYQCDVDAIGSSSMIVEAELCAAVSEILQRLGFDDFIIRLNHREVLTKILEVLGVPNERHTDALIAVDKLDKIGIEGVTNELIQRGISSNEADKFVNFLEAMMKWGLKVDVISDVILNINEPKHEERIVDKRDFYETSNRIFLESAKDFFEHFNTKSKGMDEIRKILELIVKISAVNNVKVDFSLARGLSYYTGAIFEINVPDLAGSLGGGGRYDGLIGMFGKEEIPACGFSIGLERILIVMEERGMFPAELNNSSADVLVTVWNEETIGESLKLADEIRGNSKKSNKKGLRVLVYPETDKLGKQFKYASAINVPFVCVLGETELAENKVTIKNMQTGEQETVSRESVVSKLKDLPLQNG